MKKKQSKASSKKHEEKIVDVRKLTLITGIHDQLIDYGSYFGAAIEIPPVELRFFSQHRRSNAIDSALGNVIRSVGSRYAANIVKIERPMVMDAYIQSEYDKIDMLKYSYERGVFGEEELKARIELVYNRLDELENINQENQILVPHYYLVLFDSDKRQLENQVQTALSLLQTGEMKPHRLNDKELVVFLRYTNSVDFDEREVENLDPSEYVDYILPDSVDFHQRTVEINNIITHNFRVVRYPLNVQDAWGASLFDIPGTKVVMKFSQMDRDKSIRAIDRSIGELNSQLDKTGISSKIIELQTHIDTLSDLLIMLQNDNETLMAMNFYITAYDIAATRESKRIVNQPPRSMLPRISGMKKDVKRKFTEKGFRLSDQSFLQLETYVASQVNGYDPFFKQARGVPGSTIAGVFPWIFASLQDEKGVTLGSSDGVPTFIDFFRRDSERVNSNMVIVGKSGGGKSYATKSILSNLAADDSKIFVLDPENEYTELAANLNGKYINVANASHGRINPFHIITSLEDDESEGEQETNSFSEHLQFLEEFFRQILPDINSDAMEYLNNLINRVYLNKNIDQYTNLSKLKAEDYPTFDELYDCILMEFQNTQSEYLKTNLRVLMSYIAKFSTGGRNSSIWNGPSTLSTIENFIVFNFQSLLANRNNTIANAQMLLVLKYLDNEIIKNREYNIKYRANRKIIIVIDEAHVFIDSKFPLALDFMYQMAKRIRKYNGMQIVITQNIKDFVGSEELARKSTAIINACQYSFIFSLAPNDMHDLCTLYEKAGGISETEQEQIMAAPRGRAFVVTGPTSRTTLQIETPKSIENMFSSMDYVGNYFGGANADLWDEFIEESKHIREIEKNVEDMALKQLETAEDDYNLPDFHKSGVQFIEIEENPMEEVILLDIEEKIQILEEEELEEELAAKAREEEKIAQARKENATAKALDILNEPAASYGGVFSPNHLQQLGFEALVAEIRRTVKEELQAELQTGTVEIPKAASAKKPVSSPVEEDLDEAEDEILEESYESVDEEDEDDDLSIFMKLFADDDDDDDTFDLDLDDDDDDSSDDTSDSDDEDLDDLSWDDLDDLDDEEDEEDDEDELFKDDFALEDFQFAFDEDDADDEDAPSYEEADEFDEIDLDSLPDVADLQFAIPRSEYQVPMVFELTLEELMEMTDEY